MELFMLWMLLPGVVLADEGVSGISSGITADQAVFKSAVIVTALLLVLVFTKVLIRKRQTNKAPGLLKISDQLQIAPNARILLVEISGKKRLLGLSQAGFSLLGEVQE